MTTTPTLPESELRLLSVKEYHRMAEVGILGPDEQVELVAGKIIRKMPKGTPHSAAVKRIEKLLERRLGDQILVRLQDPIQLDEFSEPEPDIAVVIPDPFYYEDHHPTPGEVYLIIEVADTTLNRDLGLKAEAYARASIIDYWVLAISDRQLYIFRNPQQDSYQDQLILPEQASVSLLAFPDCVIAVHEFLSPQSSQ